LRGVQHGVLRHDPEPFLPGEARCTAGPARPVGWIRPADRAAERRRLPEPASSIKISSTFGAPSGGPTTATTDQSGSESASVLPSAPRTPGRAAEASRT